MSRAKRTLAEWRAASKKAAATSAAAPELKAFVRYELPLSVLDLEVGDFAGTVASLVAEGLQAIEDDGVEDTRELVVVTIGRRKLGTEDAYGVEVKALQA